MKKQGENVYTKGKCIFFVKRAFLTDLEGYSWRVYFIYLFCQVCLVCKYLVGNYYFKPCIISVSLEKWAVVHSRG